MGAMTSMGAVRPLTVLDEDGRMRRDLVAAIRRKEIGPRVREMDEHGVFDKARLKQIFDVGRMGLELPDG